MYVSVCVELAFCVSYCVALCTCRVELRLLQCRRVVYMCDCAVTSGASTHGVIHFDDGYTNVIVYWWGRHMMMNTCIHGLYVGAAECCHMNISKTNNRICTRARLLLLPVCRRTCDICVCVCSGDRGRRSIVRFGITERVRQARAIERTTN